MRILHISDLHFGARADKDSAGNPSGTFTVVHNWKRPTTSGSEESDPKELARVLRQDPCLVSTPPELVIATGDIGWSGSSEDYRLAREFFDILRDVWRDATFAISPGNHDLDAADSSPDDSARQDAFIQFLRDFYRDEFKELHPFFESSKQRQDLVSFFNVKNEILLVGVNSAAHLHTLKRGQVIVDPSTLARITEHLTKHPPPDTTLRVFALHHHLLPFAEGPWDKPYDPARVHERPDLTLVANSAKLQSWLAKHQFHMVLHGHKHVSHGREDVLRKLHAPSEGHKVLVLGAGSAGVMPHERMHSEPLSYHIIDIGRMAKRRWSVHVYVQKIDEREAIPEARTLESYPGLELGSRSPYQPLVFCAERMDDCHRAIASSTSDGKIIRNFVSVVEDPTFYDVPTAKIAGAGAGTAKVEESFRALHPEYDKETKWDDHLLIGKKLSAPREDPSFQFKHGYRLFGRRGREGLAPIQSAVEKLKSDETKSHAYVGLYDPQIDTLGHQEPLPGLMGVQFVPDGPELDLVMTFRKIELSFWWVVNMLEASRLLAWAAGKQFRPRRITFFAALAQWKEDVEAAFIARLDEMPESDLMALALGAAAGTAGEGRTLAELLQEKVDQTNDVNFDLRGIRSLHQILLAIQKAKLWKAGEPGNIARLEEHLRVALDKMTRAREDTSKMRTHHLSSARVALEAAVKIILQ